ncbi:MAG TPA: LPS assembly protein LptD, partial [Terriglobales bacterium]
MLLLLLTSQLPAQIGDKNTLQVSSKSSSPAATTEEAVIKAREQVKQGNIYQLSGDVEIDYHGYVLRAEQVSYDADSGAVVATGTVVLDGGPHDAHLQAARANYNIKTESGTFYDVVGSFGTVVRGRTVVLTTNNPFMVTGREVRKVGRDRYIVYHGTITSCTLPSPKWEFDAEKIDLVAGDEAKMYHTTFRLRHIPVIYFPYAQHPLENLGRQSGFLLPAIGQSSTKGFIFGDSFYWAINRSMDATVGAEYWSSRGWSQRADFRARPSENSSLNLRVFSVLDRGNPTTGQDQGGQEVWLNGELNRGNWRAVANVDYLNSYIFRLAFSETYSQAVNSEVFSTAFATRNQNGFSLNILGERYQNFQIAGASSQVKIMHEPTLEASSVDRRIAKTPFTWGFDSSVDALARREPDFNTDPVVGRFDVNPHLALPLSWKGWDVRSEIALRDTIYSQSQNWTSTSLIGVPREASLNRGAIEGTIELRPPALAKVFEREVRGFKLKHVIEPQVTYHYVTGVNEFQQTIRFDERDILADTNEVEYGITQRIYARRKEGKIDPRCEDKAQATGARPGQYLPGTSAQPLRCETPGANTREILTWEVKQRYYGDPTFGGAVVPGRRNVFTSTDE